MEDDIKINMVNEMSAGIPEAGNSDKEIIRERLLKIRREVDELLRIISGTPYATYIPQTPMPLVGDEKKQSLARTLEGIFNGEQMIGMDGAEYAVPPNYASKSKLISGDRMKLTITPSGSFIYKQIGPIERDRCVGVLNYDSERNRWFVAYENREYRVLTASVSFYKGKPGDETIILIPKNGIVEWAAVDHIIATHS